MLFGDQCCCLQDRGLLVVSKNFQPVLMDWLSRIIGPGLLTDSRKASRGTITNELCDFDISIELDF